MTIVIERYYRFEDQRYAAPLNEYDEPEGPGQLVVHLRVYGVLKRTPKGVWIGALFNNYICKPGRFVLRDATKQFALPTIEDAMNSFRARKEKQRRIHQARADRAQEAVKMLDQGKWT